MATNYGVRGKMGLTASVKNIEVLASYTSLMKTGDRSNKYTARIIKHTYHYFAASHLKDDTIFPTSDHGWYRELTPDNNVLCCRKS